MKIIALMPVRNEAWVLPHSLACLSTFCDVVLVCDQGSTDGSLEIYSAFPKVRVLDQTGSDTTARLPKRARWRLLDAARDYDGFNLLWNTDADELPIPSAARAFVARAADAARGSVVDARNYNVWGADIRYRDDWSMYGPQFKSFGFVDDRIADYPRDPEHAPLHEPRVPGRPDAPVVQCADFPVLHLQFAVWNRNQMKQAWYRCIERLDDRESPAAINSRYAVTLPPFYVKTTPIPDEWLREVTLPPASADLERSWHEGEILRWFDAHGVEVFEPLEIWHIPQLRSEFRTRAGRAPNADRSYRAPWQTRALAVGRRVVYGVARRVMP